MFAYISLILESVLLEVRDFVVYIFESPVHIVEIEERCVTEARGLEGFKKSVRNFPGGAVVKNPPATAGDPGSSPPEGSHMPQSN